MILEGWHEICFSIYQWLVAFGHTLGFFKFAVGLAGGYSPVLVSLMDWI
jgi:hypothetical protein